MYGFIVGTPENNAETRLLILLSPGFSNAIPRVSTTALDNAVSNALVVALWRTSLELLSILALLAVLRSAEALVEYFDGDHSHFKYPFVLSLRILRYRLPQLQFRV